jgi:hypothetical protein
MTRIGSILSAAFGLLSRVVSHRLGRPRPRHAIEAGTLYAWPERHDGGWIVRRSDGRCWDLSGWTPLGAYVFVSERDALAILDLLVDAGRVRRLRSSG